MPQIFLFFLFTPLFQVSFLFFFFFTVSCSCCYLCALPVRAHINTQVLAVAISFVLSMHHAGRKKKPTTHFPISSCTEHSLFLLPRIRICARHSPGETVTVGFLQTGKVSSPLRKHRTWERKWIQTGWETRNKVQDETEGEQTAYNTHTHLGTSIGISIKSPGMISQPRIVPASLDFFHHRRLPCNLTLACATSCCGCDTQLNLNGSGTASSFPLWSGGFQGTLFGPAWEVHGNQRAQRAVLGRVSRVHVWGETALKLHVCIAGPGISLFLVVCACCGSRHWDLNRWRCRWLWGPPVSHPPDPFREKRCVLSFFPVVWFISFFFSFHILVKRLPLSGSSSCGTPFSGVLLFWLLVTSQWSSYIGL